jgi:hypothetical protein
VLDLSDASVVLELDRGHDDNWTTFYPAAFLPDGVFVTAPEGMEVWDPADSAHIGLLKGFSPSAYNRDAAVFAQLTGEQLRTWR